MPASISGAMKLLEGGRLAAAAEAFEALAADSRTGVIARFRRAECLSRLGRHDEAVAEAGRAAGDDAEHPPATLWLAQTLAEAGRFAEAAGLSPPDTPAESLEPIAAGFAALARIAVGDRSAAAADIRAVLDTRHPPLYSIALRVCEAQRLATAPRWPDLPSSWYAVECGLEMEDLGQAEHPPLPRFADPARPRRAEAAAGASWLRIHCACADHGDLLATLRRAEPAPSILDEAALEHHLAHGGIEAAAELSERLARESGESAPGELCLDRARVAQLRGEPARPEGFAGFDDARRRIAAMVAWLDLGAALLEDRPLDARPLADRLADPAHREFVESALHRWAHPPQRG